MRRLYSSIYRALPKPWRRLITSGAIGVTIGWATAPYLLTTTEPSVLPIHQPLENLEQSLNHRAAAFGLPNSMGISIQKDYIAAFDWRTRNPIWVAQMLRKPGKSQTDKPRGRQNVQFAADESVPAPFRTNHRDYIGSGLDRGHLAPSADAESQRGLEQTFLMTNISPQVGDGFNRTYWNRLERFIRRLLNEYEEVYIISGPLFLPEQSNSKTVIYNTIGNQIAVPTHFFKSVLAVKPGFFNRRTYSTATFIVPNRNIDPATPLSSFKVPLEQLESKAGLILWPKINRAALSDLCDETGCILSLLPRFDRHRSQQPE